MSCLLKGAGIAQTMEALYFTTELHTSSVRVLVQPGTKYLYGQKVLRNVCGWLSPSGHGGFTGILGNVVTSQHGALLSDDIKVLKTNR